MRLPTLVLTVLVFLASVTVASAGTISNAIRDFTARHAPEATAAQNREFGLFLPDHLDPAKPVVVLVHGLDMDTNDWACIAGLLKDAGQQVALFGYPADQPIAEDVKLLTDRMALAQHDHPGLKFNLVAFSMGSLICRGYVEADSYTGGVNRLIMISPPNHGSSWARFGVLLKCREQIHQACCDDNWHASWIITSGLCEADTDLKPNSDFLKKLNAAPRRGGVEYTVIEGDEHTARRLTADCIAAPTHWVPHFARHWWGVRQMTVQLTAASQEMNAPNDTSDGPVKLASADLDGVTDVVRVHADHATMIYAHNGNPPMAWSVVKTRLGN
jgi:pimeloyl-ACP methyl ester carboxylesterase